jgi:hypothetical protein
MMVIIVEANRSQRQLHYPTAALFLLMLLLFVFPVQSNAANIQVQLDAIDRYEMK